MSVPLVAPLIGRVVADVAKQLAKAVLAGVGIELARVAGEHVRDRLGVQKRRSDEEVDALELENRRLKDEVLRLRRQLDEQREEQRADPAQPGAPRVPSAEL